MTNYILDGGRIMGNHTWSRVLLILVCMGLCGLSFVETGASPLERPVHKKLESMMIKPGGGIEVVNSISVPREILYGSFDYGRWYSNNQIWMQVQGLLIHGESASILYVEFRSEEDAEEGLRRRLADPISGRIFTAKRIGNFAVFINSSLEDGETIAERLFEQIEKNLQVSS